MDVGEEMIETRNAERNYTILIYFMSSQKNGALLIPPEIRTMRTMDDGG